MEYVVFTFIPRASGWYGTLMVKDTTKVRRGRPGTVGSPFGVLLEGTQSLEPAEVAGIVRTALEAAGRPPGVPHGSAGPPLPPVGGSGGQTP